MHDRSDLTSTLHIDSAAAEPIIKKQGADPTLALQPAPHRLAGATHAPHLHLSATSSSPRSLFLAPRRAPAFPSLCLPLCTGELAGAPPPELGLLAQALTASAL